MKIPTYDEAGQATMSSTATPLHAFVFKNEPMGAHDEREFRDDLQAVVDYMAREAVTSEAVEHCKFIITDSEGTSHCRLAELTAVKQSEREGWRYADELKRDLGAANASIADLEAKYSLEGTRACEAEQAVLFYKNRVKELEAREPANEELARKLRHVIHNMQQPYFIQSGTEYRIMTEALAFIESCGGRQEVVGWLLRTGHGNHFKEFKPKCEVDGWVPLTIATNPEEAT